MSAGVVPVVPVRMIAAMARNGVMGKDGKLLWSIPEDLVWLKLVGLVGLEELVFCEKKWMWVKIEDLGDHRC
jgi:dihydrofolate reductase